MDKKLWKLSSSGILAQSFGQKKGVACKVFREFW